MPRITPHYKKFSFFNTTTTTSILLFFILSIIVSSPSFTYSKRFYAAASSSILSTLSQDQFKTLVSLDKKSTNITKDGSLLKPLLVPRVSGTPENKKVQEFLIQTMKNLNFHVDTDPFVAKTPFGDKEFNNIIATKDPNAVRKLVLAAHFDSKYWPSSNNNNGENASSQEEIFIGATDSAVPCAILLEVAHALNSFLESRIKTVVDSTVFPTLQLIFFDGEEAFVQWSQQDSLYGSRHLAEKWENTFISTSIASGDSISGILHAQDHLTGAASMPSVSVLKTIDAFVLLDLLGTEDMSIPNTNQNTNYIWERLVDIESRLVNTKIASNVLTGYMNTKKHGYFVPGGPRSWHMGVDDDHRPFKERSVPIVHVIPQPFPSVWHKITDNADAIDEDVIQDLANIFKVFVAEYLGLMMTH